MARTLISMHRLIANAAALLAITLPFLEIGSHAGRRIDEETYYYDSQDIYKAFRISKRLWLHTQNFVRDKTSGRKCTYFDIEDINESGMNYTSYYTSMSGSKGQMHYHGKFYKTLPVNIEERNKTNALNVSMTSEHWHPMNYRVVYSDYTWCLILRVLDFYSEQQVRRHNCTPTWPLAPRGQ
ncbi:uncharacterized protein LOC144134869 isoform X2 [Amblyomma americanum]